jgi:PmbA protein
VRPIETAYQAHVLAAAWRRSVPATCWVLDKNTVECVISGGAVGRLTQVRTADASIGARSGAHEGFVTCPVGTDPGLALDAALLTAQSLPAALPLPLPPARVADLTSLEFAGAPAATFGLVDAPAEELLPAAVVSRLRTTAAPTEPAGLDLRVRVEQRVVTLAATSGQHLRYRTTLATATVRATAGGRAIEQDYYAGSAADLAGMLAGAAVREQATHAALLDSGPAGAVPDGPVLLHGRLASRVLGLLGPAIGADAVRQRRSALAGRLGDTVASELVSITEGMTDPRCPLRAPWDDEGNPVPRVPVIDRGTLRTFLADRRYAGAGVSTGAGWRGESGRLPAVRPGFLAVDVSGRPRAAGRTSLELVRAEGIDLGDPVTGDFAFAASGLVTGPDGAVSTVDDLVVTGNVFDLLRAVEGHDGRPALARTGLSFVHSPGLWTTALTVSGADPQS